MNRALGYAAAVVLALAAAAIGAGVPGGVVTNAAAWPIFRGESRLLGNAAGPALVKPKLVWRVRLGADTKSGPVIAEGRVFVGASSNLVALALDSGREEWRRSLEASIEATPVAVGGEVVVGTTKGVLWAVEARDGGVKWKYETGERILGSANWADVPDGRRLVLVGSYDNCLHAVDAATGARAWRYETENYINGCPATDGKRVVFGGCDAKLRVVDARTGHAEAEVDAGSYVAASPALAGDVAYVGQYGNKLIAVDLAARRIAWEYGDPTNGAPFFSSPAVGAKCVVIGCRDGALHAVNRDDGRRLWVFKTGGDVDGSPVLCGNEVVVGSGDGRLYGVNLSDGTEVWSRDIGSAMSTSPAVAGGVIVVVSEDGVVSAYAD